MITLAKMTIFPTKHAAPRTVTITRGKKTGLYRIVHKVGNEINTVEEGDRLAAWSCFASLTSSDVALRRYDTDK